MWPKISCVCEFELAPMHRVDDSVCVGDTIHKSVNTATQPLSEAKQTCIITISDECCGAEQTEACSLLGLVTNTRAYVWAIKVSY